MDQKLWKISTIISCLFIHKELFLNSPVNEKETHFAPCRRTDLYRTVISAWKFNAVVYVTWM